MALQSAYIYWESGHFIGRKRFWLNADGKSATLMDGRPIKLRKGKWIVEEEKNL